MPTLPSVLPATMPMPKKPRVSPTCGWCSQYVDCSSSASRRAACARSRARSTKRAAATPVAAAAGPARSRPVPVARPAPAAPIIGPAPPLARVGPAPPAGFVRAAKCPALDRDRVDVQVDAVALADENALGALLQRATAWHDPEANRSDLEASLALLPAGLDVVLLPEMFTTGFTMETETQGEVHPGPTVAWLRTQAARARGLSGLYLRHVFVVAMQGARCEELTL